MLYDIKRVKVVENYVIALQFEDGVQGQVDISRVVSFEGIFAKLKDKDYFATVYINEELGTIAWGNGADISPSFLYSLISKENS